MSDVENNPEKLSDHVWCLHCERAYKRGEHRKIETSAGLRSAIPEMEFLEECHYVDCAGDAKKDVVDWAIIQSENDYPLVPKRGVLYPHREKKAR